MEQTDVQKADEEFAGAKSNFKTAKDEQRAAKSEHTKAEKATKGLEGAELAKATKAAAAAKRKLDAADKAVTAAAATRDKADKDLKAARAAERKDRPKLAKLTNSQRRAVCALEKARSKGIKPGTDMARTPFSYLVSVDYATESDGTFVITDAGVERAKMIDISKYALPPKRVATAS